MERRGFLKFALGGITGAVASPMIFTTLYDVAYWTQNWGWIPRLKRGENEYIPTVSKLCPGGTPLIVRLVGGRVIRTLGNPDNDISDGGLPPLAASEGQLLYAESRIKQPLLRGPDGGYRVITWERAEAILKEKTAEAKGSCAFISSDPSSTLNDLFSAFLNAHGSKDYYYMPTADNTASKAWSIMGGGGKLGYDLDNSDFILSIGASILESWGTVARNRKIFKNTHPTAGTGERTMTLAYASAIQNNTAVVADLWVPVRPSTETIFALGICRELIKRGMGSHLTGIDEFAKLVEPFTIQKLKDTACIIPEKFNTLIDGLMKAKKPIALCGGALEIGQGVAPVMATIAINMILGRAGQEGSMVNLPLPTKVLPLALSYEELQSNNLLEFSQGVANQKRKAPKVLFLYESNPLYAWPKNALMQECFDKIDFKVSFAGFWDETSAKCDLVLPSALGLERFDDVYTPYGSGFENWSIAKPVSEPRHEARPVGEVIIALAEELGYDLGVSDVPSLLDMKGKQIGASFKEYLESGQTYQVKNQYSADSFNFAIPVLREAMKRAKPSGLSILPHTVYAIGSPSTGIPPYANRVIADYQLKKDLAVVQVNSATAEKLGLQPDDNVKLETENGSIKACVAIFDGLMNGVLSVTAGLGHTEFDRFSINKGDNILNLMYVSIESGTGLPVWNNSGVKVVKV